MQFFVQFVQKHSFCWVGIEIKHEARITEPVNDGSVKTVSLMSTFSVLLLYWHHNVICHRKGFGGFSWGFLEIKGKNRDTPPPLQIWLWRHLKDMMLVSIFSLMCPRTRERRVWSVSRVAVSLSFLSPRSSRVPMSTAGYTQNPRKATTAHCDRTDTRFFKKLQ